MSTPICVTNGKWGVSGTTGSGIDGYEIYVYIVRDGSLFKDGKFRIQKGELYGKTVDNQETAKSLCILHGYSKYYSRNTTGFVMSRAARKRGLITNNWIYNSRAKRYTGK